MYKQYKMSAFDPMSFKLPGEHRVEGLLLNLQCSEESYRKVQHIQYANSDVIIASYPKAGTTLLQEIVDLIRNNGEVSSDKPNFLRVPYIEMNPTDDPDWLEKYFHPLPHPRTIKTHFPLNMFKEATLVQKVRCIYVMRNPKDVMVSFYHFYRMNEFLGLFPGSWDDFFEMIMADRIVYGNVFDHYLSWWQHRREPNILILRYEDLINEKKKEIVKIANFLDLELSSTVIDRITEATGFDCMKRNPQTNLTTIPQIHQEISPFMRKGIRGDWKNHFSTEQCETFEAMMVEKLRGESELLALLQD